MQRVSVGEDNSPTCAEPQSKAGALHSERRSHYIRYLSVVVAIFALLSVMPAVTLTWLGFVTGAALLPEEMAAAQNSDPSIVALPFDLRSWAALKLPRISAEQPEIVLIGSSRGMEIRSAMFAPYKFYNASLTAWTLDQEATMIDMITHASKPKIVIVGMDYFMFTDRYADTMARERTMIFGNGWRYRFKSCLNLVREFWKRPALAAELLENWQRGNVPVKSGVVTLFGIDAIRGVTGFRFDGSTQVPLSTYDLAPNQLAANLGVLQAVNGGPSIDKRQYDALQRVAAIGRERGVTVVAIQWPIFKATVDILDNDASYRYYSGVWREFESADFRKIIDDLGVPFFDLSRDPMNGEGSYFTDAAHPTELAMSVALTHLLEDARFKGLFPAMNAERLRTEREMALQRGERFEVYGN